MNSSPAHSTLAPRRLTVTRAQLSPLGRRSANASRTGAPAALGSASFASARRSSFAVTVHPLEPRPLPSFWSSSALDRLQPEVTRYHD